jgi:osmoprotectant transport system ATP-binding protein
LSDIAIRFENVRVAYGERRAVDDVSLAVAQGSLTVLLGPSGSGKSTLLRTVNRLVEPEQGRVEVDGRDVRDLPEVDLRRGIGYVIQAVGLFPHLTVAQNIGVVPNLLRWDAARIAARVDELLDLMRLEPARYRARRPRELSGGEAQRVGVARALAAEPRVLLMDEPFGALDPVVRTTLQDETLRIQRTLGTTFLFVTHDVEEALRIADRIVVMRDGRVLQDDTPLRILAHPADDFVAALTGSRDAVRKLSLMTVRAAMHPGGAAGDPAIDAESTLRVALDRLLDGAQTLRVVEGDRPVGALELDDIRRALAAL